MEGRRGERGEEMNGRSCMVERIVCTFKIFLTHTGSTSYMILTHAHMDTVRPT